SMYSTTATYSTGSVRQFSLTTRLLKWQRKSEICIAGSSIEIMKFALLRALAKLNAHRPYSIQWQYLRGNTKLRTFPFTSPFTGKRLVALWANNQDLREIILAFDRNKWQSMELGMPTVIVDLGSNNGYSGLYFKDRF